jgi:FkbM family methyltransferase
MFDKPMGGTELMYNELIRRLPDSYKEHFSIFNYINQADFSKITIYWNQLSHDQEAVQFLKDPEYVDRIDHFVFVSHWQAEQYRKHFNIPGYKTHVMKNASLGVGTREQSAEGKLKLCYTSTPWRGLDVLLKAWEILQPVDCELHVFSSCKIYGVDFARHDSDYQHLYDKCNELPGVVYRGSIPNEELRAELPTFDILAYPCTFEETSCIAVIEALCAGLRVITSSLGALPETTEGWADVYSYRKDPNMHAELFAERLAINIERLRRGQLFPTLSSQVSVYRNFWNWKYRYNEWGEFLTQLIIEKKNFTARNTWEVDIFRKCYVENEYEINKFDSEDVIIDLGTHIGSFSLLAYDRGSRNIHTFEVSESNYNLAVKNLQRYGINLYNTAVWRSDDDRKTINFEKNVIDWNTGMGRVRDGDWKDTVEVSCTRFDDVLSKFDRVRFLKMDIEGSEYPILFTSKQLYKIEEIVGEFHEVDDVEINGYRFDRRGLKRFLEENSFVITKLENSPWSEQCGLFRAIRK